MSTQLLLVGSNSNALEQNAGPLRAAGFVVAAAPDVKKAITALEDVPALVLVMADPGTPEADAHLQALHISADLAAAPVAFVTSATAEADLVRSFRTGVVDLHPAPTEPGHVQALLSELPHRPGAIHGSDRRELQRLLLHILHTRRSGTLTVNAKTTSEGTATFLDGEAHSAASPGATGGLALAMMQASALSWSFAETAGAGTGSLSPVEADLQAPAPSEPIPLLLVDDEPMLCQMFAIILKSRGFAVTTAEDGVQGYEAARAGQFEVVVSDLAMPRLDGWGLLRQLRDDYATRELPVAFLSSHEDYRQSLGALDAGAQAYLSKSIKHDALAAQIRTLLNPRNAARAALDTGRMDPAPLDPIGPQWLAREVARREATGKLWARDGWAAYEVFFYSGMVIHAVVTAGTHRADGERAFNAYVASRGAQGAFEPGELPADRSLGARDVEELLRGATQTLNDNERSAREALLVNAKRIDVNQDLYALYAQVGPPHRHETARLVCEEKLPPAEVISRLELSPLEVEETLRDLIRRGVIRLST